MNEIIKIIIVIIMEFNLQKNLIKINSHRIKCAIKFISNNNNFNNNNNNSNNANNNNNNNNINNSNNFNNYNNFNSNNNKFR